jgi:hypothetical protein
VAICEAQIAISGLAADALRQEYPEGIPAHSGYQQLRIIRDKAGDYRGAIELCRQAMAQGWAGTWEKDIALELKRSNGKIS